MPTPVPTTPHSRLASTSVSAGSKHAERGFTEARDRSLALDRDYDAILASLFLADALLAAGKTAELRRLAADLVPLFQARGVERETLASLRLLAQAVQAETLTAPLLAELRHSTQAGSPTTIAPAAASPSGER